MAERKRLIGITGRAGSGKDTVTRIIKSKIFPEMQNYAFAGPLKAACCEFFGWDSDQIEDRVFKETVDPVWGFSPRRAMQLLGTEWGRQLRADLWIHMARVRYESPFCVSGLIISDARFENEGEFIRTNGGILIHVIRPGEVISENAHASEAGIEFQEGDIRIYNDGTLEDLEVAVREALAGK